MPGKDFNSCSQQSVVQKYIQYVDAAVQTPVNRVQTSVMHGGLTD